MDDDLSDPDDLALPVPYDHFQYGRDHLFPQYIGHYDPPVNHFDDTAKDHRFHNLQQTAPLNHHFQQPSYAPCANEHSAATLLSREPESPPPDANSQPRVASFDERFKLTIDYRNIMTTVVSLKEQKNQSLVDLRKLEAERARFLNDPQHFLQSLFKRRDLIPPHQTVTPLPSVDFKCYEDLASLTSEPPKIGEAVRGRTYTSSKPVSFNLPWTYEEQKKLEQLLIEYPDEPVSAYRWEKIARVLGNRTPKQVGSRVQKYFIRLAQAGLPVPGRVPNLQNYTKEKNVLTVVPKHSRASHVYTKHINYYEPPAVKIAEKVQGCEGEAFEMASFGHLKHTPEYKELVQLYHLKRQQESTHEVYVQALEHTEGARATKCHACGLVPIIGYAYRCQQCPDVHLCEKCQTLDSFSSEEHHADHLMEKSDRPNTEFVDPDYVMTDEMNYLDPYFLS